MDNNCSEENQNSINMDMKTETINDTLLELRAQIKFLRNQNESIRTILDEENKKGFEMTKLLRARRPFNRTKTGELIFPGKKDMEFKLDIMTKEILKLKSILDSFQKDRCKIDMSREIFKSISCLGTDVNTEDAEKKQLIHSLDEQYNKMKEEFDEKVLEISKYRVKLDVLKRENDENEKRLKETQIEFNEASTQIAKLESIDESESHEKEEMNLKNKLHDARQRLNGLESVEDYQMDELKDLKKSYMNAIHEKEYQIIRANNLCKEKDRMTTEFEIEFNRVKEYYKKRLQHVENCPTILQALQGKLSIQKEIKTSVERTIDIISKKLKSIIGNSCNESSNKSKQLTYFKTRNINLKKQQEELEVVLYGIQKRCIETKRNTDEQKHRLDNLQNETACKIKEIRDILREPTEEYLRIMDKLQNQISKIEAHACFEDGKTKLVSAMMQDQISALANILKNAQEQITEIQSLQNYLEATQTILCKVLDCKVFKFN